MADGTHLAEMEDERNRKEKKGIDNREGRGQTGRTRESCFFITMETTDPMQKEREKK